MNYKKFLSLGLFFTLLILSTKTYSNQVSLTENAKPPKKIKVLIIDGQNNHGVWPKSTIMMKQYLEETGLFKVDIERTKYLWKAEGEQDFLPLAGVEKETTLVKSPKQDPDFCPKFRKYDVVVSNFGWKAASWSEKAQKSFEKFIRKGGGFVSVHAANNSFPEWLDYNKMIGLGGWGGRDETNGPYVYYNNDGEKIVDNAPGKAGSHGSRHEFPVTIRENNHPITKGMPKVWLTTADECYAKLRGPAENMTILATGKDQSKKAPTNRHEPIFIVTEYGKGKVFNTILGHDAVSFESVGFITSFTRGVEWVATGKVTQEIPSDFSTQDKSSSRPFVLKK
ncbi:ThuA domain-containing protein [Wenyingzhuangia fucanilytica]|uniref:ThuA domain-containing protein n=1 Tax=Wenyingzhuangia fucanilytica TaxID=1790137 RepID=UPI0009F2EDA6|nr:ThuA domain-containing protein [Wenyingzhuangia fucanilytica]